MWSICARGRKVRSFYLPTQSSCFLTKNWYNSKRGVLTVQPKSTASRLPSLDPGVLVIRGTVIPDPSSPVNLLMKSYQDMILPSWPDAPSWARTGSRGLRPTAPGVKPRPSSWSRGSRPASGPGRSCASVSLRTPPPHPVARGRPRAELSRSGKLLHVRPSAKSCRWGADGLGAFDAGRSLLPTRSAVGAWRAPSFRLLGWPAFHGGRAQGALALPSSRGGTSKTDPEPPTPPATPGHQSGPHAAARERLLKGLGHRTTCLR